MIQPFVAKAELQLVAIPPHIVFDVSNGAVYDRNKAFVRWAPASLTKLMTAYTVFKAVELQHLAMNSPVRITEEAIAQPPSKMGFPIGTILTIENAVKILMVKSANDVSVALAQAVGGSEEQFINLMNSHARRLGMTDTNFTNPHGLHHPNQFTTARDMALLTMKLTAEFPQHAGFFKIPAIRVAGRRLRNHNALLRLFEGTNGLKTGYVCASGFNVIVRTKRADRELATVVMGHKSGLSRNVRAAELLNEAFAVDNEDLRPSILALPKPTDVSDFPEDITRSVCPGKYAETVRPARRPLEPLPVQDFDDPDLPIVPIKKEGQEERSKQPTIPVKRPKSDNVVASDQAAKTEHAEQGVGAADKPKVREKSLREKAKALLKPHGNLAADMRITLGGGVGPNPFGIKHTNGGVYQPPIPVPQKRPTLDLSEAQE